MIIVKVELHSAISGEVTELGRMMIDNVGGNFTVGDYRARTYRGRDSKALDRSMQEGRVTREGRVESHRRQALHVWHLVGKALAALGYNQ